MYSHIGIWYIPTKIIIIYTHTVMIQVGPHTHGRGGRIVWVPIIILYIIIINNPRRRSRRAAEASATLM